MNLTIPKLVWETIIWYMPAKTKAIHYNDYHDNIIRQIIIEQSKLSPAALHFWAKVVSSSDVPFPMAENEPFMIKLFKDYIWFLVDENEVIIKGQKSHNKVYFTDLVNVYYICNKNVRNYFKHKDAAPNRLGYKNKNPSAFYRFQTKLNKMQFCEIALIKHNQQFTRRVSIECLHNTLLPSYNSHIYSHQYMMNSPNFLRCYVPYSMLTEYNRAFKVSDMTFDRNPLNFYENAFFVYKTAQYSRVIKPWQKIILDTNHRVALLFDIDENEEEYSTLFQQKYNYMRSLVSYQDFVAEEAKRPKSYSRNKFLAHSYQTNQWIFEPIIRNIYNKYFSN